MSFVCNHGPWKYLLQDLGPRQLYKNSRMAQLLYLVLVLLLLMLLRFQIAMLGGPSAAMLPVAVLVAVAFS